MQVVRVARLHQEGLPQLVGGVGEGDLLAALGRDEHARGDHVEAAGPQPGNQRGPLGEHAVHLGHADALEDHLGDLGRFAGQLAAGARIAEGRLVGEPGPRIALVAQLLQRALRGRGGDQAGQEYRGQQQRSRRLQQWFACHSVPPLQ